MIQWRCFLELKAEILLWKKRYDIELSLKLQ